VVVVLLATSLAVATGLVAGHGSISVGFATETVSIDAGDRAQVDVIVDNADDGVDTYELTVSTESEGVVTISDASVTNGRANVTVDPNGTRIDVSASGLDRDGSTAEVLTLTLAAQSNGTETLSIDAASVLPPAGAPYLTTERGTADIVVGADDSSGSGLGLTIVVAAVLVVLGAYAVVRRR